MQISNTEENYLKAIYHLSEDAQDKNTSTNILAEKLGIKPASVTSMLKKLKTKALINYEPYAKIELTQLGSTKAIEIIRKHRLWEVFLVNTLGFSWDEVHEVAEQLEHIQSPKLINKLDAFLLYPTTDPHGDPIPDAKGEIHSINKENLSEVETTEHYQVVSVNDNSSEFLQFLISSGIGLSTTFKLVHRHDFDQSILIELNNNKRLTLSKSAASHIQVVPYNHK